MKIREVCHWSWFPPAKPSKLIVAFLPSQPHHITQQDTVLKYFKILKYLHNRMQVNVICSTLSAVGHSAGPSATTTSSPRWTLFVFPGPPALHPWSYTAVQLGIFWFRRKLTVALIATYHESMSQTLRTDMHVHIQYSYNIYICVYIILQFSVIFMIMINID